MGGDGGEVCTEEVCLCHYDNLQGSACCELAQSQMPSYGTPVLPWVLHHKKVKRGHCVAAWGDSKLY